MNNVILHPTALKHEPLMTVEDVAAHYRFKKSWVYEQIKKGMPHRRIGGRLRFCRSDIDEWFEEQAS